jgi:antibiotic biosynthesis monooxygenase (ABM) superfamily enzyme
MAAFNAVRFRVKPGREQEFLDAHMKIEANWPGLKHANMIKTGDRTYCIIAEWTDMDALANARFECNVRQRPNRSFVNESARNRFT